MLFDFNKDEYEYLKDKLMLNENKELRERIDKAIEYIEDYHIVVGKQIERGISNSKDELLEILKAEKFDIKKEKEFEYKQEYLIQKSIEGEEE